MMVDLDIRKYAIAEYEASKLRLAEYEASKLRLAAVSESYRAMNIEQEIQNILDRNFTRGDNAKALKELLDLFGVVGQGEQLKSFADYLNSRLGEPMYSTQAHVDEYLKSL